MIIQAEKVQFRLKYAEQRVSFSLYCTPSGCTAHSQPVLHTLSLYCTLSVYTAHSHPVLHIIKYTGDSFNKYILCLIQSSSTEHVKVGHQFPDFERPHMYDSDFELEFIKQAPL